MMNERVAFRRVKDFANSDRIKDELRRELRVWVDDKAKTWRSDGASQRNRAEHGGGGFGGRARIEEAPPSYSESVQRY